MDSIILNSRAHWFSDFNVLVQIKNEIANDCWTFDWELTYFQKIFF